MAQLDEEFSRVYSIRELADGRVLISDNSSDSRLVVADFNTGQVRAIGRVGNGPGEYVLPTRLLLALPGDSTLLVSGMRPPRWSLLHADRIVATVPGESRAFLAASDAIGADDNGGVLALRRTGGTRVGEFQRGYNAVIRVDRTTGRTDTVFRGLRDYDMQNRQVGTAARPFMISSQATFSAPEKALLLSDGWIGTVRFDPYRVEWRSPDGTVVLGEDLGWARVKIDDREKAAYTARVSKRLGRPADYSRDP